MKDLKAYFKRIRDLAAELEASHPDGCVFIASVENPDMGMPAGKLWRSQPRLAAECIVNGTHRLAEPDAIASFLKQDELAGRALQARQSTLNRINKLSPKTSVAIGEGA
jgi:hypothetical protein